MPSASLSTSPSSVPSPSVSALAGLSRNVSSSPFGRPSPSESSRLSGMPSPSVSAFVGSSPRTTSSAFGSPSPSASAAASLTPAVVGEAGSRPIWISSALGRPSPSESSAPSVLAGGATGAAPVFCAASMTSAVGPGESITRVPLTGSRRPSGVSVRAGSRPSCCSTAVGIPSPSGSSRPSITPSLLVSAARGLDRTRNSLRLSTPSRSGSRTASRSRRGLSPKRTSQPSGRPSPSVSRLCGSVPSRSSAASESPSPSASGSAGAAGRGATAWSSPGTVTI